VVIHFGPFTLDEGRRQLFKGSSEVHVSPKVYELLTLLVCQRPRALAKAELHERLWPHTFVSEVNLAALIAELRAALGEHGRQGGFIRTVHGFGYAFDDETPAAKDEGLPADPAATPPGAVVVPAAEQTCWLSWGEHEYPVMPGTHTIGRDRTADIRIDVLSVSRLHARLSRQAFGTSIDDLASKNGTWVSGVRVVAPVHLEDGDEVRLGSVTLVFHDLNAPGRTVTHLPS
jgi:DNA-binding winged helix-turn-helix (wHTH) protein